MLRGLCILAILLFHTEMYYVGETIIDYNLYVSNVLTAFYFISGYVFVPFGEKPFSLRYKLISILRNIVIPYFIFTMLLAIPKAYVNDIPLTEVLLKIAHGNGSWFVTSLISAELCFALLISLKSKWLVHIISIATFVSSSLFINSDFSNHYNYWNVHNAMIALWFLDLGWLYRRYENLFQPFNRPLTLLLLLLSIISIKVIEQLHDVVLIIEPVIISHYLVFFFDTIIFIAFLVSLCKQLPPSSMLAKMGRWSLVIYFFCGAIPMAVGKLMHHIHLDYQSNYLMVIIVFIINTLLSSVIAWIIYHYTPELTGQYGRKK